MEIQSIKLVWDEVKYGYGYEITVYNEEKPNLKLGECSIIQK